MLDENDDESLPATLQTLVKLKAAIDEKFDVTTDLVDDGEGGTVDLRSISAQLLPIPPLYSDTRPRS